MTYNVFGGTLNPTLLLLLAEHTNGLLVGNSVLCAFDETM